MRITGSATYSPLTIEFRRVFKRAGVEVLDSDATASATLAISGGEFKRRVLSVDVQGRAAEYELNYRYTFKIVNKEKVEMVPVQTIQVIRDYRFDPNNVLAKEEEEAQIRTEMIRFSVSQAMRRIDAILNSQQ